MSEQFRQRVLISLILSFFFASAMDAACISSGSGSKIQAALQNPGDIAKLCQGAVFDVTSTIKLTQPNQVIRTQGTATGNARALLRAVPPLATVIDGRNMSGVEILRLRIDGRRGSANRAGDALIRLGGVATGQRIARTKAWDPRGWSILHIAEGSGLPCSGAIVTHNELGPAGRDRQNQWADGISLACQDSLVKNNTIIDATDGGIVIFGAPGSTVESNTIRAETRTLLGGINMVDYLPYFGDYSGVTVRYNLIQAQGGFVKTGIAMGTRVWSCPPFSQNPNRGARVIDNTISGWPIGYGYVVDGVSNWTVTGNRNFGLVGGAGTSGCDGNNARPGPFLKHAAHAQGTFQSDFTEGVTHYALGVVANGVPF